MGREAQGRSVNKEEGNVKKVVRCTLASERAQLDGKEMRNGKERQAEKGNKERKRTGKRSAVDGSGF